MTRKTRTSDKALADSMDHTKPPPPPRLAENSKPSPHENVQESAIGGSGHLYKNTRRSRVGPREVGLFIVLGRIWTLLRACCMRYPLPSRVRAQHAFQRRESEEKAGAGSIAGAWASRDDLLETKKVRLWGQRNSPTMSGQLLSDKCVTAAV